jgi:clan AA aspartic protease
MGNFKEKITLANAGNMSAVQRGYMKEGEIRMLTVDAIPDTGAWTLVINEEIREKLGLRVTGRRDGTLADGNRSNYGLTEPVEVRWQNRDAVCRAAVLPGAKNVLLGTIPLEDMDLMVDPVNRRLAGVHGDEPMGLLC